MSLYNNLLSSYQNLCPKCTQWLRRNEGTPFKGKARKVYGPAKD